MKKKMFLLTCAFVLATVANVTAKPKVKDEITVISREAGSGTRSAFIELFGVEQKDSSGKKVDYTTDTADITNSTEVVLATVAKNASAVGYVSLGSLNDSVKALKIDGVAASIANIKSGSYKISRPFNVVTKDNLKPEAQEFLRFIMSKQGQEVIEKAGYISVANNPDYVPNTKEGKVSVAGSSSVFPVMEKLQEAFRKVNPLINVEVSQSDSTVGVTSAINGVCDIGMASRDLKANETGVKATRIAIDGIAVIVNKQNQKSDVPKSAIKDIYTGVLTKWSKIK